MSSWADMSDDHNDHQDDYLHHAEDNQARDAPRQRKKLQLKPRSATAHSSSSASGGTSKSNPFGAAKPREEVLASKGIDAKTVDERIQKKAEVLHFTREQNEELEAVRAELTKAEADLRNANEQELPEENFRVLVEEKRKDLNELTAKFTKENAEKQADLEKKVHEHKFERPSERRRRLDEEAGHHKGGDGNEEAFASFGGRRHSGRRREGDGGYNF